MLYSVNMLRNFQRRKCCKEITDNSWTIVRPHREVLIFVVLTSVGQLSWNWRTVGDLQKRIVSRSSLPVGHFFHRCFFHLYDFVKSRTSETPECAAFSILWLNAGAQITHGDRALYLQDRNLEMSSISSHVRMFQLTLAKKIRGGGCLGWIGQLVFIR